MTNLIRPGAGVIFMKVGTHAKEELSDIIARKRAEIEKEGFTMWGYGGNTCHPTSMVQPFAKAFAAKGQPINLVMHSMNSKHYAEQVPAEQFSVDGVKWQNVPKGIKVLGSKFALTIKALREEHSALHLSATKVAVGPNAGRIGSRYIRGQADKACLEIIEMERANEIEDKEVSIDLVAELIQPYAVFLKEN